MSKKIKLGSKVKDKVTEYEGVATGHCEYLTGCDTYLVAHKVNPKTGGKVDGVWFDVNRLEVLQEDYVKLETEEDQGAMETSPER